MSSNAAAARQYRRNERRFPNPLDDVSLPAITLASEDPLAYPEPLIRRIYAYVAYRLGDGPEAEDVVASTFERAVRYRHTYNRRRGEPIAWLVGIAKHCMNDARTAGARTTHTHAEQEGSVELEAAWVERLALRDAVSHLNERDQELIALRYGADLSAKAIAQLVGARTNAVEVALHRALGRLREELAPGRGEARPERAAGPPPAGRGD